MVANSKCYLQKQRRLAHFAGIRSGRFHTSECRQLRTGQCEVKSCIFTSEWTVSLIRRERNSDARKPTDSGVLPQSGACTRHFLACCFWASLRMARCVAKPICLGLMHAVCSGRCIHWHIDTWHIICTVGCAVGNIIFIEWLITNLSEAGLSRYFLALCLSESYRSLICLTILTTNPILNEFIGLIPMRHVF